MAKLSRQVIEIIKTIIFLLIIGTLFVAYVIYPLNRTKAMMGREGLDDYNDDSLIINDPAAFLEINLPVDTFRVESDGLTKLACLYIPAVDDSLTAKKGTVLLLHKDGEKRDSLLQITEEFHDSGFVVITYDQRASGRSTGKYRGEGYYESSDLQEIVRNFEIREKILHPLYIVGWGLGAEGAMLASLEEKRIDGVIAINPYLTTKRMQNILKKQHKAIWFPFYRTIMWWWYNIRSSYAAPYREIDDMKPVTCPTLIIISPEYENEPEITHIKEISPQELLKIENIPKTDDALIRLILSFMNK